MCADYDRIAALPLFQQGIRRILDGRSRHTIALMYAEKAK